MIVEITKSEALVALFRALGDPTRLGIFETLRCCGASVEMDVDGRCRPAGSLSVGEVCCRFEAGMSTISHHLKELRLAGLVRTERRGRSIYYCVNPAAIELIREFAEASGTGSGPGGDSAEKEKCCEG